MSYLDFIGRKGYEAAITVAPFLPVVGAGTLAAYGTGIHPGKGFLQGLASGVFHFRLVKPLMNWLEERAHVAGPEKISLEAAKFFKGVALAADIVVPAALIYYGGEYLNTWLPAVPEAVLEYITIAKPVTYTAPKVVLVTSAILATLFAVEHGGTIIEMVKDCRPCRKPLPNPKSIRERE